MIWAETEVRAIAACDFVKTLRTVQQDKRKRGSGGMGGRSGKIQDGLGGAGDSQSHTSRISPLD